MILYLAKLTAKSPPKRMVTRVIMRITEVTIASTVIYCQTNRTQSVAKEPEREKGEGGEGGQITRFIMVLRILAMPTLKMTEK